jgi:FKBP-type peptidyl-prolyl cis-trans isomerase
VDDDAPEEFTTTASGLKYRILRKTDKSTPSSKNHVRVHYRGSLESGEVFDSSYDKGAEFIIQNIGTSDLIEGWKEGLLLVPEGGMIEMIVPSDLGYGEYGMRGKIPPNATLRFIVELVKIEGRTYQH